VDPKGIASADEAISALCGGGTRLLNVRGPLARASSRLGSPDAPGAPHVSLGTLDGRAPVIRLPLVEVRTAFLRGPGQKEDDHACATSLALAADFDSRRE
jgi:hypothetical protein